MLRILCRLMTVLWISIVVPNLEVSAQSPAGSVVSFPVGTRTGEKWNDNHLNIEFLWCEPGKFTMGSPKNEKDRGENEDQVEVTLTKGFWLGKYEVTQEQWQAVMNTDPWLDHRRVRIAPDSPACWVSWEVANLFCRELTRQEREAGALPDRWDYVLPTEAQWEYACRAGTTTKFSFGDDERKLFDYAWYGEEERRPQQMHARAVGTKMPNPWGFYDMHGNVVEWCRDWFQPKYPGGTDPFVSADQNAGVTARGGEWRQPQHWSRSAHRQNPGAAGIAATIGFRVSLQQETGSKPSGESAVTLAVVSFENRKRSVEYDRLGRALTSLVVGNLSQYAGLDILERQTVTDLQKESSLSSQGKTEDGPGSADRKSAGYMLTGSYVVNADQVSVTARLNQTGIGKPVGEWAVNGNVKDLLKLEADLSQKIITTLKIGSEMKKAISAEDDGSAVVAVLPFANNSQTSRLDEMETGFAELLQASLAEVPEVRLVERQAIEKILSEQNLTEHGLVDAATAIQIGRLAGASRLITGSFLELGPDLTIQVRMISSRTGAIMSSARVSGATSDFDQLLDQLTQRMTEQLGGATATDSESPDGGTPKTSPGSRSTLESALYVATAERFRREGKLPEAIQAYENAILLDPTNVSCHVRLVDLQGQVKDFQEAVRTGEHLILEARKEFDRYQYRDRLLNSFVYACVASGQIEKAEKLLEEFGDVSESFRTEATREIANGYISQKKYPKAVVVMEKLAEEDVKKNGVLKSTALQSLFNFNVYHATSIVGIPIPDHQVATRKAIEIYERVLNEAAKTEGAEKEKAVWATTLIPVAINIQYLTDDNRRIPFLSDEKKATYREKEAIAFSAQSDTKYKKPFDDGIAHQTAERWQDAIASFESFLEVSLGLSEDSVQPLVSDDFFPDWLNRRIEAQSRIALILGTSLGKYDECRDAYRKLVSEYGLVHPAAPESIIMMHRLGVVPEVPENSMLVWGCSTSGHNAWERIARAENLTVHSVRKQTITLADLAPYRIVVLNLSQVYPLMPSETLALRSYAASGGSLLIIASPAWSEGSPWILGGLLSFFDMEVFGSPTKTAASTKITPHPITKGISEFIASNCGGLRAPEDAVLISAGENTILAAREYRRGRVVVSTAGQWFTPEVLLIPENEAPRTTIPSQYNTGDHSFYRSSTKEPPLLRQVLRWLGETHQQDKDFLSWQSEWKQALFKAQQAQACMAPAELVIVPWNDLSAIFDGVAQRTSDRELKEETLWAAGESMLQKATVMEYVAEGGVPDRTPFNERSTVRVWYDKPLICPPKYYKDLADQFPMSDLRPFALMRLVDCRRLNAITLEEMDKQELRRILKESAREYHTIGIEKGTYARAWALLQAGSMLFELDEYEEAVAGFDEIGDTAPVSPEKSMALLNSARSHALLENYNEALRRLSQVSNLPDFMWTGSYAQYQADSETGSDFLGENFRAYSTMSIARLNETIPKLGKNADFLTWRKQLKESRTNSSNKSSSGSRKVIPK